MKKSRLVAVSGPWAEKARYRPERTPLQVGRGSEGTSSREHIVDAGTFVFDKGDREDVRDLGSQTGSFVGMRYLARALHRGDIIELRQEPNDTMFVCPGSSI